MAPSNKAKAAGVSASSFLDLKSEVARAEEQFAKAKASGKAITATAVKRPGKKPTVWTRPNKGVESRALRDIELEEVSKPTLEAARSILERKSQIYDKLSKGKTGGLNEKQYEALLVDFDSKPIDEYEPDSDDVDESLTVPRPPNDDNDPIVEYEDEFGRVRSGRRSEIPRHLLEPEEQAEEDFDPYVIYNPVNHFPTYEPSADRVAAIQAQLAEEDTPLDIHYDASREVRAKGAGFYQFSGDEVTREKQMEELKKAREETERTRTDLGAVDLRPGEVEGMQIQDEIPAIIVPNKSRAMEKRKHELEERRKLLDAKRRKKDPTSQSHSPGPSMSSSSLHSGSASTPSTLKHADNDPFVALETLVGKNSEKQKSSERMAAKPVDSADAFLASLERDILGGSKG